MVGNVVFYSSHLSPLTSLFPGERLSHMGSQIVKCQGCITDNYDRADLDGDGEFDATDITILEDSEGNEGSNKSGAGCCVALLAVGSSISGGWWAIELLLL